MAALSIIFERARPVSQSLCSPCCLSRLLALDKEVSEGVSRLQRIPGALEKLEGRSAVGCAHQRSCWSIPGAGELSGEQNRPRNLQPQGHGQGGQGALGEETSWNELK